MSLQTASAIYVPFLRAIARWPGNKFPSFDPATNDFVTIDLDDPFWQASIQNVDEDLQFRPDKNTGRTLWFALIRWYREMYEAHFTRQGHNDRIRLLRKKFRASSTAYIKSNSDSSDGHGQEFFLLMAANGQMWSSLSDVERRRAHLFDMYTSVIVANVPNYSVEREEVVGMYFGLLQGVEEEIGEDWTWASSASPDREWERAKDEEQRRIRQAQQQLHAEERQRRQERDEAARRRREAGQTVQVRQSGAAQPVARIERPVEVIRGKIGRTAAITRTEEVAMFLATSSPEHILGLLKTFFIVQFGYTSMDEAMDATNPADVRVIVKTPSATWTKRFLDGIGPPQGISVTLSSTQRVLSNNGRVVFLHGGAEWGLFALKRNKKEEDVHEWIQTHRGVFFAALEYEDQTPLVILGETPPSRSGLLEWANRELAGQGELLQFAREGEHDDFYLFSAGKILSIRLVPFQTNGEGEAVVVNVGRSRKTWRQPPRTLGEALIRVRDEFRARSRGSIHFADRNLARMAQVSPDTPLVPIGVVPGNGLQASMQVLFEEMGNAPGVGQPPPYERVVFYFQAEGDERRVNASASSMCSDLLPNGWELGASRLLWANLVPAASVLLPHIMPASGIVRVNCRRPRRDRVVCRGITADGLPLMRKGTYTDVPVAVCVRIEDADSPDAMAHLLSTFTRFVRTSGGIPAARFVAPAAAMPHARDVSFVIRT